MKKFIPLLVFSFLYGSIHAQKLNAVLSYSSFCTAQLESYIEFTFLINGQSARYVLNDQGKYQAEVRIKVDVEQSDSVVQQMEYILVSSEFADSVTSTKPDIADVRYLRIPNGDYILRFHLKDENSSSKPIQYIDNIQLYFPDDKVSISGVTLLEKFAPESQGKGILNKYGYAMLPLFYSYVPEALTNLPFIIEIYNTEASFGKDSMFLIKSYIESIESSVNKEVFVSYRMKKSAPISVLLSQFDISRLPSGNYNLVVEVMAPDSTILASNKAFFQRSNPSVVLKLEDYDNVNITNSFVDKITDVKIMRDYVASLYPISSAVEQNFYSTRLTQIPLDKLQRYFYSFWLQRDAAKPEQAWLRYKAQVDFVQQKFGSKLIKGYRTDRGRVFLRYGPPNTTVEEPHDPQAYPYEIWHYYVLDNQTNVKFVFYNRDLVSNDYELLHSDALGEHRDPAWQMKLTRRLSPSADPDVTRPEDYWGGHANDRWKNTY